MMPPKRAPRSSRILGSSMGITDGLWFLSAPSLAQARHATGHVPRTTHHHGALAYKGCAIAVQQAEMGAAQSAQTIDSTHKTILARKMLFPDWQFFSLVALFEGSHMNDSAPAPMTATSWLLRRAQAIPQQKTPQGRSSAASGQFLFQPERLRPLLTWSAR